MADYLTEVERYPVRAQVRPGDIAAMLPAAAPQAAEPFAAIMADFERIVMPGMTHWQHPSFFAYFPANSSPPSVLAEMLTATLAAQGMLWQTSPAATEMETRVLDWLRQMIGLPEGFAGGGIKSVPGLIMKETEQARGEALRGAAARVSNGLFWIALSEDPTDRAMNLRLLRERDWIDIPILYENDRRAILTLRKGNGDSPLQCACGRWLFRN